MSDETKSTSLIVHANEDIITIPAHVAEKVPLFKKHIDEKSYDVPLKLEMSAIKLIQSLEPDLDVLSREKKAEYQKKLGRFSHLIGKWVDAKDSVGHWCHAKIINAADNQVQITFPGCSAKWDEWLPTTSDRLRAFGSQGIWGNKCDLPKVGDDIGQGRVWSESFQFPRPPSEWI